MLNVVRRWSKWVLPVCIAVGFTCPAKSQVTTLGKQLERIDLAVSGFGEFTKDTSGVVLPASAPNSGAVLLQSPGNTLGALVTVRYTKSPLVGGEFNVSYARYTQNFGGSVPTIIGGAQTNASEYTFGYVAHLPEILNVQPFGAVGAGSIAFRPTAGGGQGLPTQARAVYYYGVGVEKPVFSEHFGLRAQFRQLFYLAPDFGQNYLTNKQRTMTSEPAVGFFLHF